ncbi:hypothetical protein JRO89_XS01G0030500 [Xanthoceras sorbifolium]|uniref:Uncharacterized protein n=1 Tax=Xanthoceras sorbifolium TaxID=99658 RepID=A0ABQ8IIL7_9ROSI|nr:hypothetical protein JRO89_XS01G0030500 [Xanthoceras sorbifolium]
MNMTAAPNTAVDVGLLSLIRDVRLDRALFQPYKKKKNGSLAFHTERAPVNIEHNMATQQQISKSFNCLIPMLIGVLQVNSQSNSTIHALGGHLRITSSISIVSVLLPRRLGLIIFIPWTFVPIIVAYQVHAVLIRNACQKLNRMMINIISKLSATCTSIEQ